MSNALAVRCRNPGEFIASVVERHRRFPLPRSEDEKTYLIFIGESEEGILDLIPGPGGEFVDSSARRSDPGEYGGEERERYPGVNKEEAGEDVTSPRRVRARRVPRRIQIRYVPRDKGADNVYGKEGRYHNHNSEEDESEASEDNGPIEGVSPIIFQMQQGRMGGGRTANEGELNEITVKKLVEQPSRIPMKLPGGDKMGDDRDERSFPINKTGLDKLNTSQGLNQQFSQSRSLQKESEDRSDKILGEVEERHYSVVSDPQCHSREGGKFPTTNEEFPQSPQIPMHVLQGTGPRVPNETPPTNLSTSPWPLESGAVGEPNEVTEDGGDGEEAPREATPERREKSTDLRGVEEHEEKCPAVNKIPPQAPPPRRQSILQVREPGSPTRPWSSEISPLTTPSNSSPNLNANEEDSIKPEEKHPTEADEDETLSYPATTLENLIATEHIDIIYLEDLKTLHGFLEATMFSPVVSALNPPLLAIWGLVGAHYQTEYFWGGGIGETVAQAVETAAKSGRLLVLGEGYIEVDYGNGENEVQEQCWMDVEIPIFDTGSMIVGRTVRVGQILRRWCRLEEDLEDSEDAEEGGEGEHRGDNIGAEGGEEGEDGDDGCQDVSDEDEDEDEAMYELEEVHGLQEVR